MKRRRYWLLSVLALAVLVTGNWWLNQRLQQDPSAPEPVGQNIDYALGEFEAQFFDSDGKLTLDIGGPRLEHDAVTREARIPQPRFVIDPDDQAWAGTAEFALIERESRRLTLKGEVRIEKPHPRGIVHLASEEVQYDRANATLHSPGPADMRQDGTELSGGTLTAWLDKETMELEQDVHAIYRAVNRPARAAARD